MESIKRKSGILLLLALILFAAVCAAGCIAADAQRPPAILAPDDNTTEPGQQAPVQGISVIYVEDTGTTDAENVISGVKRLIRLMQGRGLDFYQTQSSQNGLIASGDVVLLEINCQWAERGGTNTDLIRGVIQALVEHPGGFSGEIIVADNGQAQYGSERRGGSLNWANANSADRRQSVMDVVRSFRAGGYRVTGVLWDDFTAVQVEEFSEGNNTDGFVVENTRHSTGLEISYPKFTTEYGTRVSFKEGIWIANTGTYDSKKLKVINMPVLKSHGGYQVTGAVKGYMGTTSDRLTGRRAHNSIGLGGMGTQMAGTRMPVLNIMDMIWIGPERGPNVPYASAKQINKIAASIDPVALDYWASKYILMPEAARLSGNRAASMNPDGSEPGTFGYWLRLSMNELHKAGIQATMNESEILVVVGG